MSLSNDLASKVLFVSIDYKVPRGGIASVLNTYSTFISPFKFVRTASSDLNGWQKIWYALSGYAMLCWKLLVDRDIKIVHIHSASGSSFWRKSYAIKIAKAFGKKVIFHCHGGGFKEFRLSAPDKIDTILAKCDSLVCLSKEWEDYFNSIGCKNVCTIKNVIGQPLPMQADTDSKVHFLFLGLIGDNKGIFDILCALKNHKKDVEGKIVLHVGGNGEVERLKQYIVENKLTELVSFEGWVDKEKKVQLLNLADVYMLPSFKEGVPISILEAESYHEPVITTNVGGIPSIVHHGKSGLFVTPGNSEEIYHAMITLADNPELRKAMGNEGFEISKEYLPETIAEELVALYNRLLA